MSAALLGMAVGALVLGPVADRIGRKNMMMIALSVNAVGLFFTATSTSAAELGLWRVVTGLGIGGILVSTNVISAEYASRRRRGLAISIYAAGYGIGAAVGGSVMISLIGAFGWRSVFVFGGSLTVMSLFLVIWLIPESASYLYNRKPANAQKRLDAIAAKLGHNEPVDLSATESDTESGAGTGKGVSSLLNRRNRRVTLVVWATFFIVMFGFYFVNSWTPRLMNETGLSESLSMVVTVGLTVGGAIGSVTFGLFTSRWSTRSVLMSFSVLAAIFMAVFVFTAQWLAIVIIFGVLVGMFTNGCIAGLMSSRHSPTQRRCDRQGQAGESASDASAPSSPRQPPVPCSTGAGARRRSTCSSASSYSWQRSHCSACAASMSKRTESRSL